MRRGDEEDQQGEEVGNGGQEALRSFSLCPVRTGWSPSRSIAAELMYSKTGTSSHVEDESAVAKWAASTCVC